MGQQQRVDTVAELRRQRALVVLERDSEREEFKRVSQALGIEHNIARGNCHYPLRLGRSYYNSLNQLVVEVFHDENKPAVDNEIGAKTAERQSHTSIKHNMLKAFVLIVVKF